MVDAVERKHIAERFVIHFFSSGGVMLGSLIGLKYAAPHLSILPAALNQQVLFAAVCIVAGTSFREAYDMKQGQTLTKAIWDYSSWVAGCLFSAWAILTVF